MHSCLGVPDWGEMIKNDNYIKFLLVTCTLRPLGSGAKISTLVEADIPNGLYFRLKPLLSLKKKKKQYEKENSGN